MLVRYSYAVHAPASANALPTTLASAIARMTHALTGAFALVANLDNTDASFSTRATTTHE